MKKIEHKDRVTIHAARNTSLQVGIAGTRMDTIVKEADVLKTMLYKNYSSKDKLFTHLIHQMFDQNFQALQYSYDKEGYVDLMFQNILIRKIELIREPIFLNFIRILSVEFIKKYNFETESIKDVSEGYDHLICWMEQCLQDEKISKKHLVEDISLWFHSLLDGLNCWALMNLIKHANGRTEVLSIHHQSEFSKDVSFLGLV